jgi:hypothetical protein
MGGSGKSGIPPASHSPFGGDESLPLPGQILENVFRIGVPHHGSVRHREDEVLSASPYLVFPFSVLSSFGAVFLAVTKIEEGGELAVGFEDYVPAFAPVASVGASAGNELLTAKTDATVPSVSGLDEDFYFIDELDRSDSPSSFGLSGGRLTIGTKLEPLGLGRDRR